MIKFLDLNKQYQNIKPEIEQAMAAVISKSAFVGGEFVESFESNFAEYQQAKHCIGVGNGTDALEIAIEALELKHGSEIIVPANSFIASSEAVTRSGCKVVFCDCDQEDYTISINDLRKKISTNTSALIAVHLYGHPCDMDALINIAKEYDLKIIEDCAQAHGAEYKGKRVGTIGDIGTFSFYPGKNLGAYGDGGAIVTNDDDTALKCRMIANHGRIAKYNHKYEGRNSRLDGLQAAILDVKLKHLNSWTKSRIEIAELYSGAMSNNSSVVLPVTKNWAKHVFHLFVIRLNNRDKLKSHLEKNGIQTGIHYPVSLPNLQAYKHIKQNEQTMKANDYQDNILSLPIGEHISNEDVNKITNEINAFVNI